MRKTLTQRGQGLNLTALGDWSSHSNSVCLNISIEHPQGSTALVNSHITGCHLLKILIPTPGIWRVDSTCEPRVFSNGHDLSRTLVRIEGRQRKWQGGPQSGLKSTGWRGVTWGQLAVLPPTRGWAWVSHLKLPPSCLLHLRMGPLMPTFSHRHVGQMGSCVWKHFVNCSLQVWTRILFSVDLDLPKMLHVRTLEHP